MSDTVERFKMRKSLLEKAGTAGSGGASRPVQPCDMSVEMILASASGRIEDGYGLAPVDPDVLLADIRGQIDAEKFTALIDSCQRECLQTVIRPFGLGRILFEDKDGGNVTTTHNFKEGIVATDEDRRRHNKWERREGMDWQERRKPFDAATISDRAAAKKPNAPPLVSGYTGQALNKDKSAHYEHVTPVKEIETDIGRNLRMSLDERVALSRSAHNTTYCEAHINSCSAKLDGIPAKDHKDLLKYYFSLTPEQRNALGLKFDLVLTQYVDSKSHIALADAKSWLMKDGKEICATGAREGGKMALQQALGVLMEEFVRACFAEVKDAWRNGFISKVDESFLEALKSRLARVAERVQSQWKDAAFALRDGFISGFMSNLITVIINTFATTAARQVRMLREGGMALYRALKTLAFPDEGVSLAQAADAATKVLAGGLITAGGIAVEGALATWLEPLGPLASYMLPISVGLVTGLGTAFAVYMLDRLDLFGAHAQSQHEQVMARLNEIIEISHERIKEAAAIFDPPALPHLT